ncbi:MAG: nitroreductase [Proteobacteria bacterium]|nr:nitroreductase [Pseudomonadota bacterium]MBU1743166.1 nitroreductase [Pseudomonadota bacterium]
MDVLDAMKDRHSCRAFTRRPVEREIIEELLRLSGLAPSAINLQPWECTVVLGEELRRLGRSLQKTLKERQATCGPEERKPLAEVFGRRMSEAGQRMAPLLAEMGTDIPTYVNQGTLDFYGAPAGLVFYIDAAHPERRLVDAGILLGYLFVAARALGLATCPIGLITQYADQIFDFLNVPADKVMALGVAVGYPDESAPINRLVTPRALIEEWVRWY